MSRKVAERNQFTVGIVGLLTVAVLLTMSVNVGKIRKVFFGTEYSASFTESGGVRAGDDVRVAGMDVGSVSKVELVGHHVEVSFNLEGVTLGSQSRAAIKSDNALGRKYLELTPQGSGSIDAIPIEQTEPPYGVTEALEDLTVNNAQIDVDQLAASFTSLSETFSETAPSLDVALDGVSALSQTISARDAELAELLQHAEGVTDVLSARSADITSLIASGNAFLAELQTRRLVIQDLLVNTTAATAQLEGLVADNEAQIGPALAELRGVIDILNRSSDDLGFILQNLGGFIRALGEAVGGGPFFYAYLQNLVPADLAPVLPNLISEIGSDTTPDEAVAP